MLELMDADFKHEVLESDIPVLVDFWAPWCGPCVALTPILVQLAEDNCGKIKISKMNVDDNVDTPAAYGVRSIPFLVLFKNGEVVDTIVGSQPKVKIQEMINSI
jgi:thioredoxin 1